MSGVRVAIVIVACICGVPAAAQQSDRSKPARAEFACLNAARDDYQSSKLALLKMPAPRTIQAIVSERRVEEEYCLRVARCVTRGDTSATGDIQASVEFAACLEEVTLDKYDAKKRGD
ncbi:hypothetical protein [Reyranella sp.]|jgi:hypothetical protein|uniref:hypothetical protein n=1 Tax=Reyranella sp. TaxID=1929291 RepID=UPI002F933AE7